MKSAVGRILNAGKEAGLEEDTLIVFTSDHGENLGSHGLVQKGTENDESIRIPLIMAGPDTATGHQVKGSVASLVDLAPTFLACAGLAVPDHMQGTSPQDDATDAVNTNRSAFFQTTKGMGLRSASKTIYAEFRDGRNPVHPALHGLR